MDHAYERCCPWISWIIFRLQRLKSRSKGERLRFYSTIPYAPLVTAASPRTGLKKMRPRPPRSGVLPHRTRDSAGRCTASQRAPPIRACRKIKRDPSLAAFVKASSYRTRRRPSTALRRTMIYTRSFGKSLTPKEARERLYVGSVTTSRRQSRRRGDRQRR